MKKVIFLVLFLILSSVNFVFSDNCVYYNDIRCNMNILDIRERTHEEKVLYLKEKLKNLRIYKIDIIPYVVSRDVFWLVTVYYNYYNN